MIQLVAVVLILASLDQAKSETSWDDDDWKIDGIDKDDFSEGVLVQGGDEMTLQIRTDSKPGGAARRSYLRVDVKSDGASRAGFNIYFGDPMTYNIPGCYNYEKEFSADTFPTSVQKVWTISLTGELEPALTVDVNGVRVAEMSSDFCTEDGWKEKLANIDYEAAEFKVQSDFDTIDGYMVVDKEDPENDGNDNGETENEDNHDYSGAGYTNISTILFCTLLCTIFIMY